MPLARNFEKKFDGSQTNATRFFPPQANYRSQGKPP